MDQQKLRTLVFEKTGVRIDIDDPIFALVALNEAVLAEAVERHVELLDDASADLADQVQALQDSGWRTPAQDAPPLPRPAPALVPAPAVHGAPLQEKRLIAIAGGAALLCAFLCAVFVLAGQALLARPLPLAAAPMAAKELTPAQSLALQRADKLDAIIEQLDPKTRNAILAEMQKP